MRTRNNGYFYCQLTVAAIVRSLFLIVAFVSLAGTTAQAQISIGISVGYETFNMKDNKALQEADAKRIFDSLHVKPSTMYNFPSYWSMGGKGAYSFDRHTIGINIRSTATAGRLDYEDYSGLIRVDRSVNTLSVGAYYGNTIVKGKAADIKLGFGTEYYMSKLTFHKWIEIFADQNPYNQTQVYTNQQLCFTPNVAFTWYPASFLFVELNPGARIQLTSNNFSPRVTDSNGDNLVGFVDWSGFYTTLTLGVRFGKKR